MKLWLARHARPLVEAGVCYGSLDVAADVAATQAAAAALARDLPQQLAVFVSPLRRCAQLAEALQPLRPDLAAVADARLREMDFGAWEGQPWDAIGRTALDDWKADFAAYRCGGGECVRNFMARVAEALAQARASGRDTLWITHAGVLRAVRLLAQGVAVPARAADWPVDALPFGTVTTIVLPAADRVRLP